MDINKIDLTKLYDTARDMVEYYRDLLNTYKVDASGALSASADFDFDFSDTKMTLYFILNTYWYYVENGRQPSRGEYGKWVTPNADIQRWLRNKINKGNFIAKGSHTIPTTDKEIKKVAGAIVHKITKFGYYDYNQNGKHLLQKTLDDNESLINDMVDYLYQMYDADIEVEFQKI